MSLFRGSFALLAHSGHWLCMMNLMIWAQNESNSTCKCYIYMYNIIYMYYVFISSLIDILLYPLIIFCRPMHYVWQYAVVLFIWPYYLLSVGYRVRQYSTVPIDFVFLLQFIQHALTLVFRYPKDTSYYNAAPLFFHLSFKEYTLPLRLFIDFSPAIFSPPPNSPTS